MIWQLVQMMKNKVWNLGNSKNFVWRETSERLCCIKNTSGIKREIWFSRSRREKWLDYSVQEKLRTYLTTLMSSNDFHLIRHMFFRAKQKLMLFGHMQSNSQPVWCRNNNKPWCWGVHVDTTSAICTREHFRPLRVFCMCCWLQWKLGWASDGPEVCRVRSWDAHAVKVKEV